MSRIQCEIRQKGGRIVGIRGAHANLLLLQPASLTKPFAATPFVTFIVLLVDALQIHHNNCTVTFKLNAGAPGYTAE